MMVDIEELQKAIDDSDVFAIGFRLFPKRLFIDTRADERDGPMIRIVEPLDSVEARYHWLGRERPSFGVPERFIFVPWPHSLQYLEESNILQLVSRRLTSVRPEIAEHCDAVFGELRTLEHRGMIDAIHGEERYHTIWSVHN